MARAKSPKTLREAYIKNNIVEPWEVKIRPHFRASEASACQRKVFYDRSGYIPTNEIPPQGYHRMDVGTALHPFFLNRIVGGNVKLIAAEYLMEASFKKKGTTITIRCKPDGYLQFLKKKVMLEMKTTSEYGLKGCRGKFTNRIATCDPDHYSFSYIVQCNLAAFMEKRKVDSLCIFVATQSDWDMWEMAVSKPLFNKTLEKFFQLERCIQDGTPPEHGYAKSHFMCKGCTHRDHCWGDLDSKVIADEAILG